MTDRSATITLSDGTKIHFDITTKIKNDTQANMKISEATTAVNQIIGSNINLNADQINITTVIDDAKPEDYPNSSQYINHNWGYFKESRRIAREDTIIDGRSELRIRAPNQGEPDLVVQGKITALTPELQLQDEGTAPSAVTLTITYDVLDQYYHNKNSGN